MKFNVRLFYKIAKRCNADKYLGIFTLCLLLGSFLSLFSEPRVHSYWDAFWYTFTSCTSIGYGDFVAQTVIGRVVTIVLTVYEIFLVAMLAGLIVSHYLEVVHRLERHSATIFIDKLEHLTELSREELAEVQERAKEIVFIPEEREK